jgi:hypothetical protein
VVANAEQIPSTCTVIGLFSDIGCVTTLRVFLSVKTSVSENVFFGGTTGA